MLSLMGRWFLTVCWRVLTLAAPTSARQRVTHRRFPGGIRRVPLPDHVLPHDLGLRSESDLSREIEV